MITQQVQKHKMFRNVKTYPVEKLDLHNFVTEGDERVRYVLGDTDIELFQDSVKALLKEFTEDGGRLITKTPDVVFNKVETAEDLKERKNRTWEIVFAVVHMGKVDGKFLELLTELSYEIVDMKEADGSIDHGCYILMKSTRSSVSKSA